MNKKYLIGIGVAVGLLGIYYFYVKPNKDAKADREEVIGKAEGCGCSEASQEADAPPIQGN